MFQNYFDLQSIMSGESLKLYEAQGPLILRASKDITYLFIIIALLYYSYNNEQRDIGYSFSLLLIICLILFVVSAGKHDWLTAALGLRWITPLLIFMLMKDWVRKYDGFRGVAWVYAGMLICVGVQIYQLFNMPPVFGTIFGLSARTPGFFLAPNTASFFGCTCAVFVSVFGRGNFKHKAAGAVIAFAISALAQSGTGIVVSAFLLLHVFLARSQAILFFAVGLAFLWILPNLDALLSRDGFTALSGGGRIDRFNEIVSESAFSLNNFGYYTNAANLADSMSQYRKAVDSLIASFIGNFGALTALVVTIITLFVFQNFKGTKIENISSTLFVFSVFAFSTIIFEAYPMNIILALSFWGARNISLQSNEVNNGY